MDFIDMKDDISTVDDQLAFLAKAFSYGLEISENESRGVGHFLASLREALPQQTQSGDIVSISASK